MHGDDDMSLIITSDCYFDHNLLPSLCRIDAFSPLGHFVSHALDVT